MLALLLLLFESLVECAWVMLPLEDIHNLLFRREVEVAGDGVLQGCSGQGIVQLHLLVIREEVDGVEPAAHESIAHTNGIDDVENVHDGRLQQFAFRPEQARQGVVL